MHSHSPQADDAGTATEIGAKLAACGDTNPIRIDVTTTDEGVASLRGRVYGPAAREALRTLRPLKWAKRRAWETQERCEALGVRRVIDLVKVGDLP
jgi:hypothetical protein